MAWKKIDDDQALPDMPYSSFLANGLTTNANSYNEQLRRGSAIGFVLDTGAVKWSSYHNPRGTMFTADVGVAVTEVEIRIVYNTSTTNVDANGFQGEVTVKALGGNEFMTRGLLPTLVPQALDFTITFNAPVTGLQAFAVLFKSSKLVSKGNVLVSGGVNSQIFLEQQSGGGAYPITTGEKNELLSLNSGQFVVPSASGEVDDLEYQINNISLGTSPYYASVYPSLTNNPPRLGADYVSGGQGQGEVFELGAMTLLSIAYTALSANTGTAPPQLSHNTAAPLAQVIQIQNDALFSFQPDLCNGLSQRFSLNTVLAGTRTFTSTPAVNTTFAFSSFAPRTGVTLRVSFRGVLLTTAGGLPTPKITVTLLDNANTAVVAAQTLNLLGAVINNSGPSVGSTARGYYSPDAIANWGMRDSMLESELSDGNTMAFSFENLTIAPAEVYTVKIAASNNAVVYLYNMYGRFTRSVG